MININVPDGISLYRLWAIDEISVRVVSDSTAWIDYKKYIVNAERHRIVVRLNWLDRIKGITLETKIKQRLNKLKLKLENENIKIREHKRIEELFN